MRIISNIILSGVALLAVYIAFTFIREYREAHGSTWDRLLEAGRDSATILVQKITILISGIGSAAALFGEWFEIPELKQAVQSALKPEYVVAFVVVTALVSWFARKRTLGI